MSNSHVCPEKLNRAKELYFQYFPVVKIAEEVGIKRSTVQYHVNQRWKAEREMVKSDLLVALLEGREDSLAQITDFSIRALVRSVKEVATRQQAPTVQEARNIVTILEKIDSILHADKDRENQETDKAAGSPTSLEDLKKKIAADPFSQQ